MKPATVAISLAAWVFAAGLQPVSAQADTRAEGARPAANRTSAHHRVYHRSGCWSAHHRAGRNGTIIGALTGGFLGSQLAGSGSRTGGMLIGAGVGAIAGHQIGAHSHRCR
jgi:hypothetical protein